MTTKELAKMMGVTEGDVIGFLAALNVWIQKGYSFEAAIAKNLETMELLASRCLTIPKGFVVETFFPVAA